MLEFMRRQVSTWFIRIFLLLLIASFALWGIGDIFRGGRSTAVATVGDTKIMEGEVSNAYRRELNRLRPLFGGTIDTEKARELGIIDRTLDGMVARALFDQEVKQLGLVAGDDLVREQIQRIPQFQTVGGQFDRTLFQMAIQQSGFNEEGYVAEVRRDTARSQLLEALSDGVEPPRALVDALFAFHGERRRAELLILPETLIDAVPEPDEATVEAHYRAHPAAYTQPELRAFSYIHLRTADLIGEADVTEEQLKSEYEARLAEFQTPERRDLEQLLAPTQQVAAAAAERAAAGDSLEAVAAAMKEQGVIYTGLGTLARADLPDALAQAAFTGAEGATAAPVQSDFGWHVMRARRVIPASTREFAEVRGELLLAHQAEQAADAAYQLSTRLEDALAGGATLEEAAGNLNLTVRKVPAMDERGRDGDGATIADLPGVPNLASMIARAAVAEDSTVLADNANGFAVFRVDSVTPSRLRPLDEVRARAVADWKAEERRRGLAKAAEGVVAKLASGATLDQIGAEMNIPLVPSGPIARGAPGGTFVTGDLADALFGVDVGQAVNRPAQGGNAQVIARLTEIDKADQARDADALNGLREQLRRLVGGDITDAYRRRLAQRYPVSIDRTAVDRLF